MIIGVIFYLNFVIERNSPGRLTNGRNNSEHSAYGLLYEALRTG
jgi:hypothetical protein